MATRFDPEAADRSAELETRVSRDHEREHNKRQAIPVFRYTPAEIEAAEARVLAAWFDLHGKDHAEPAAYAVRECALRLLFEDEQTGTVTP